jgi:arylsulfatase A-like enzyme
VGSAGRLSDAVLHVPLVLRHPDSLTGQRIFDDVVGLEDVAPTLVDWMRLPPLPGARGRSLLAVTDSYVERPFEDRPAFAQLPERATFSVRDARWRLVWSPTGAIPAGRPAAAGPLPKLALYDLEADPFARRDVSHDQPEVLTRLGEALRSWRESLHVLEPAAARRAANEPR